MTLHLEDKIKNEVETRKNIGSSFNEYDLVSFIAPFFILVNPPLVIVLTICCEVVACYKRKGSLDEAKMPDSWLKNVAQSEKISKEGLEFLGNKLSKNGFISVSDSIKFLDLEQTIAENIKDKEIKDSSLKNEGAILLLNKANSVCGDIFQTTLSTFTKSMSTVSELGNKALKATTDFDFFKKK